MIKEVKDNVKKDFLERFSISEEEFEEAGFTWEELCYIARDYAYRLPHLRLIRDEFLQEYIKNKDHRTGLHSYRTRIKSPWHLVEKIIRKRCENYPKYRTLTKDNYMKFVTDTIGFRGLILYREDWVVFHKYLIRHFENNPDLYIRDCIADFHPDKDLYMAEPPKVHMRLGDFSEIYSEWIPADNIFDRKHYRSVHYILKYKGIYMEVQLRTLFEEGWGEIDHHILYPYKVSDPMLTEFSELLNRLSGMGDEMASFFKRLCDVSSENFRPKQTTVNPWADYSTFIRQERKPDLHSIHTIDDAILSVIKK